MTSLPNPAAALEPRESSGDAFRSVVAMFDQQTAANPTAAAATLAGGTLSYQQLADQSARVAAALVQRGVGVETLVGIAAEPSFEMLAAIWGVLRAGGAYLPLDPAYPQRRLEFMLRDSQCALVLTTAAAHDALSKAAADLPVDAVRIDELQQCDGQGPDAPPQALQPQQLAYVIYTSGSTGVPKGVLLQHDGLANMAACHAGVFGVGPGSRVLQFASLSFDAAVHEIFMTHAAGGALALAPRRELLPGRDLAGALQREAITNVLLPPTALAALPADEFPALRTLIAGGERCPQALAAQWAPGRDFFNAYGPTETTVTATIARCTGAEPGDPPIGHARAGAQLHLRAADGSPIDGPGEGELLVSGVGVARGYLNRPELTAERFIEWPPGNGGSVRAYCTGDRVRRRADGALEFLDRLDRQVKVRGFRVELGEIEARLAAHPQVEQAAVVAVDGLDGPARLAGFYAIAAGVTVSPGVLRAWLGETLPAHMTPSHLAAVAALPVSPAGKVDLAALASVARQQLAAEGAGSPVAPVEFAAGADSTAALCRLWESILGVESVGPADHFIELGGDSLAAAQIADQAAALDLYFTAGDLLAHPTPARLAAHAGATNREGRSS